MALWPTDDAPADKAKWDEYRKRTGRPQPELQQDNPEPQSPARGRISKSPTPQLPPDA